MRRRLATINLSNPCAGARPVQDAFGALALAVILLGALFLPAMT